MRYTGRCSGQPSRITMLEKGHYWESPYIQWAADVPEDWILLIFTIRGSRNKAIVPAVLEALALLHDYKPIASLGGPLADRKGVFWIGVKTSDLRRLSERFRHLGYSCAVDQVVPLASEPAETAGSIADSDQRVGQWRGNRYRLRRLYREDSHDFRNRAPDRREFLLEDSVGFVRWVKGYRGDGYALSRRGLPVEDARLLVNLVMPSRDIAPDNAFLDPFAGVGGIVLEAIDRGFAVYSIDIDARLRHGLKRFGSGHVTGDGARLPLPDAAFSAIATEPPYHRQAREMLLLAFEEMIRVLKVGGRLVMMVSSWQADLLLREARLHRLKPFVASPINRKGTPTAVLGWTKIE